MAKAKRVAVSFQPATHAALERLAEVSGQSMSGIVSAFMDDAVEGIEEIVRAVMLAKTKPIEALDLMQEQLAKAQHIASQGQLDLVESRKRHNKRRAKK